MCAIWSLRRQHNVTLVLNRHDHHYQHLTALDGDHRLDRAGVTQMYGGRPRSLQPDDPPAATPGGRRRAASGALRLEVRPDRVDSYLAPHGGTGKGARLGLRELQGAVEHRGADRADRRLGVVNPSSLATL